MKRNTSRKQRSRKLAGGPFVIRAIYVAGFGLTIAAILQLVGFTLLQLAEHLVRK
jgi:hypothetical protein